MLKVLLVDDEPIFRMGLRAGIQWEEAGCRIVGEAKNGEEALIQIEEKNPDLVLLDIKMPKMGGIEVLKRIKNKKNRPEFIVLSCFNEYEYVREAMKLGACDYLFKPLMEGRDILAAVREAAKNMADADENHEDDRAERISVLLEHLLTSAELDEGTVENIKSLCPELDDMPYFVLAVKIPGKMCKERKKEALLALCKSILIRCFDEKPLFFCEKQQVLYGLFLYLPEEGYDVQGKRKKLWKKVKEYVEVPVWIGSSLCMRGSGDLKKAFDQAESALRMHFFSCFSRDAVEFAEYCLQCEVSRDFSELYAEQIKIIEGAFGKYDLELIRNTIAGICNSILAEKLFSEKDFSHMLANIVIGNMRAYKCRDLMERLLMEEYNVISDLYHQETMEEACNYFFGLLEEIFRLMKRTLYGNSHSDTIQNAIAYMREHYSEKISLPDIAGKVSMSEKYFCKLFKEETGETFVGYLTKIRVQEAREMLTKTNLKTYEVAEKAGFKDYHHFCKTFKRITGKTPREIRTDAG